MELGKQQSVGVPVEALNGMLNCVNMQAVEIL